MTNQQAINILNGLEQCLDDYCELNDEGKAAFRMAITALESFGNSEQLSSAQPDVPDTNVGDMIYRQAAINSLHMHLMYRMGTDSNKKRLDEWINNLPSAQPGRKKGRIVNPTPYGECSECGCLIDSREGYNFCPNCGADMRGEQDGH